MKKLIDSRGIAEKIQDKPGISYCDKKRRGFRIQLVKDLPAMQATLIQFLGQEDLLEKGYAPQYSWASLVAQWAPVHGVAKSRT